MQINISRIESCEARDCSYNKDGDCHTLAITVGDQSCAKCDTYTPLSDKGGAVDVIGAIGACREADCKYNLSLECNAGNIKVGMHSGHADCVTYAKK